MSFARSFTRLVSDSRLLTLTLALSGAACSAATGSSRNDAALAGYAARDGMFRSFTRDPVLHAAATRAIERIENAIGQPRLELVDMERAGSCTSLAPGCGFELSFAPVVYCFGDPEPAMACTALGPRGVTLGVELQASLQGEELENRLIHEFFHVITFDRAQHSEDGLFMEYSVGDERITASTLEAVCAHFPCTTFVVEEGAPNRTGAIAGR